ncbi:sortase domain-bontaining protein [Amnibacterium flavum]|uniref:Class F sortase n=1 Tax=Amnibacterium flavum TaxID=2173173 RepID=A0A2V1HVD5_9MICO|nr:sortase [Amnibacterium flavum]PVZ94094.1 class F sortase [Amnibacterium flavum]
MTEKRAPRHRGRWTPLRSRARRTTEQAVAGAIVLLAVVAVTVDQMAGATDDAAAARLTAADLAEADLAASDPITFSEDPADLSAASVRASALQDPRPVVSGPSATLTPAHLRIESIGVDVDLTQLNRRTDGSLEPPTGLMEAGWYTDSAVPGAVGPAVIAGHVDDTEDAGIFSRLHEVAPGTEIVITLSDGTQEVFTADSTADVAKAAFPTDAVYGPTRTPQLRLITCNGPYDFNSMHYSNNLVLFASGQQGGAER